MGWTSDDLMRLGPAARKQIMEQLTAEPKQKQKYNNVPDTRGALKFDSKKEARRYDELMLLLEAKKIRNLKLQPQFTLQESYITPEGERIRAIRYNADFSYETFVPYAECRNDRDYKATIDGRWSLVVEDVKSQATRTPQYQLKKKLLRERLGIEIVEVDYA